jgi:hypothetical protein
MIKDLLVRLKASWDGLKNALNGAVKLTQSSARSINGATKQIEDSFDKAFSGNFRQSIAELNDLIQTNRDRLIEARSELQRLQAVLRNQKKGTKEFGETELAIRKAKQVVQEYTRDVGELNIQLRDQKNSLADSRLQAEDNSSAMEALGRAVNAASMATLLLSDDNKKLKPVLDGVRTTMALASGAIAIYNLSLRENNILTMAGSAAQKAYAFAVGTSTGAMKLFRLALAATGIGAFVVALGYLIEKLSSSKSQVDELNNSLVNLEGIMKGLGDIFNSSMKELENQLEIDILNAKLAGKSVQELQKIKNESYKKQIEQGKNIQDQAKLILESERKKLKVSKASEEEKSKKAKELLNGYWAVVGSINQRISDLQHQQATEEIQLKIDTNEKLKEQEEKRTKDLFKAEEDRKRGYDQYRKERIAEERQLQQLLIDQMKEGKDKELAQLKFNYENEISEVKYNNALKVALTDKYNKDVASVNKKYADNELRAIGENFAAYINHLRNKRDARKKWDKETNEEALKEQERFNQKVNEQFKNALNQFTQTVVSEVSNSIRRAFEGVGESSEIGLEILKLQQRELEQTMKDMERSEIERLQARQQYLKNQEDILEQSRSNMSKLFRGILLAIGDFLVQLGTSLIVTALATEKFKESLFTSPKAAAAAGAVAIAAGLATRAIIENGPRFANGGIVSGPTLGLVGEYPGASTNPEVIAPLDKLQSMLGGMGTGDNGFIAETRVSGRDLALVLSRYNKDAQRG